MEPAFKVGLVCVDDDLGVDHGVSVYFEFFESFAQTFEAVCVGWEHFAFFEMRDEHAAMQKWRQHHVEVRDLIAEKERTTADDSHDCVERFQSQNEFIVVAFQLVVVLAHESVPHHRSNFVVEKVCPRSRECLVERRSAHQARLWSRKLVVEILDDRHGFKDEFVVVVLENRHATVWRHFMQRIAVFERTQVECFEGVRSIEVFESEFDAFDEGTRVCTEKNESIAGAGGEARDERRAHFWE
mmetsp:Transcript_6910/g.12374  ORF Transcript_6910/g.12374 Transcript_6910/m.12374 type:complete len:242 (-) Transcript_6910:167-892(-)